MVSATRRAEVVAEDEAVAERFRDWLEGLRYSVEVVSTVQPDRSFDCDVVVYDVSLRAARAERRSVARDPVRLPLRGPQFWLDAVRAITQRAPAVPLLVTGPAGEGVADKALDSGATDVIEGVVTAKLLRRRLEMLHAFTRLYQARRPGARRGGTLARPPALLEVPLAELRNPRSGRIDAERVAKLLGIPLRRLATAMELNYTALHKTPDSPRAQPWLQPVVRILEQLDAVFGSRERARIWLHRPLRELEDESPLQVILAGEAGAVETLLHNARAGLPA